ncbi:hypothetical protein TELCIR_12392, partial [Teladorsagia circumcincta]
MNQLDSNPPIVQSLFNFGLGRLWADYDPARWQAVRLVAYAKVLKELDDNAPEVRAAAVYALGCLVKNRSETNEHAATIDQEICDDLCNKCTKDGSVLVRELDESQPCTEDVRDRARSWRLRRERAKKQLAYLENKNFKEPLERTWILAVDPSVQSELFKENGDEPARFESTNRAKPVQLRYHFFVTILNDPDTLPRQKIVVAFVLATLFHNNYRIAQENLTKKGYVNLCTELLSENQAKDCRLLKLWILIGLGRLWADYDPARWQAVRLVAYAKCKEDVEDFTDRALTLVNPTDWAIFIEQAQQQHAHAEFEVFKSVPCDSLLVAARVPSSPTVVSLSMLRKSIYTTDVLMVRRIAAARKVIERFPSSLHCWSQETGRLVCGGNVRVIRVWDAHYERTALDIAIAVKKGAVTALSGELDHNDLIAAGYRDGVVNVHDIRVPAKESLIMSFHDLSSRIVGVAIRVDSKGNAIVAAGDEGGGICVWEP